MNDHSATATGEAMRAMSGNGLLDRMPSRVVDSMTAEQRNAVDAAAGLGAWARHPVNIRFSLPWGFGRFYVTIVGGSEKRSPERRIIDRQKYPLRTLSNIFFFTGLGTLFYTVVLIGLAVHSSIVEF